MPTLFVFLFKVNIALLLFCAGYYLVLRHLTFYVLNRIYLVTAIIFATVYPKIDLTAFAQRHENIAAPVQTVLLHWQVPAAELVKPFAAPNYWARATLLFWAGVALLALRLFVQLFSLLKLYRNSVPATISEHGVRLITGKAAPFSFWRSIYVNPDNHSPADLQAILLHEQAHVNGWHTIDILLAELSSIFYWFNPGVWLIKKAVRENIEFITDRKILNNGVDTKAYQYSLVNVSFNTNSPGIVNHFNISTIKKRIIMMNAKRSSKFKLTRYAFVLPAIALLLVFSLSDAAVIRKGANTYKEISHAVREHLTLMLPSISSKNINANTRVDVPANARKNGFIIYYINGVKQNKTGEPNFSDETESIYYLIAADAKKYFNAGDGKHKVGFVTTLGSVEGKNIKDKIAELIKEGKVKAGYMDHITVSKNNNSPERTFLLLQADTARKTSIIISATNRNVLDSLNYLLNGKKISSADFKKIDPNKIVSVNIRSADEARLFLDDFDSYNFKNGSKILFITTSDSENGKKLANSLSSHNQISAVNVIGKTSALTGHDGLTVQPFTEVFSMNKLKLDARPVDSVLIYKGDQPATMASANRAPVQKLKKSKLNTLAFTVASPKKLNSLSVKGFSNSSVGPAELRTLNSNLFYTNQPISRISDKLIVIDGKEATEKDLKKLSAFEIDRMSTSSDADTVKKYGVKAKYGVVYIYTKRAK